LAVPTPVITYSFTAASSEDSVKDTASNLEAITPPWLGFRILSPQPIVRHVRAQIAYELRWRGLPLRWLTAIETWDQPHEFVDIQVRGPHRLWYHTH
jgi:ligand-binding SRPBCC domain-containing protein